MKEVWDGDHLLAHRLRKFCHLFSHVSEKSVGFPSPNEHDHVIWYTGQNHGHCGGAADGMETNGLGFVAQFGGP